MTSAQAATIAAALRAIPVGDKTEEDTRAMALSAVDIGQPMIRTKVDFPDPHLVSYVLVTDGTSLLLADHRKSGLWLPCGGHVEPGESPEDAAHREAQEELGIVPEFWSPAPFFVTFQRTTGAKAHHDLLLWYLMRGARDMAFDWDRGEFTDLRWFQPDALPTERCDPNLPRAVAKLRKLGLMAPMETAA